MFTRYTIHEVLDRPTSSLPFDHSIQPQSEWTAAYRLLDLYSLVSLSLVERATNPNTLGFEILRNKAGQTVDSAVSEKSFF